MNRSKWLPVALVLCAVALWGGRKYYRHRAHYPRLAMDETSLAAVRAVRVQIYSAEWCQSCEDVKTLLRENGVPYDTHDIEKEPGAEAQAFALSHGHTIPVVDVAGSVMVGYDPPRLFDALTRAAAGQTRAH